MLLMLIRLACENKKRLQSIVLHGQWFRKVAWFFLKAVPCLAWNSSLARRAEAEAEASLKAEG